MNSPQLEESRIPDDAPFEAILERLQAVVEELERGEAPLAASIRLFEEGVTLSRMGSDRLDQAESRVTELIRGGQERPLPPHSHDAASDPNE